MKVLLFIKNAKFFDATVKKGTFWIFTSTTMSVQNWEILSTFCGLLRKLCTQCYLSLIFFVDIENLGEKNLVKLPNLAIS